MSPSPAVSRGGQLYSSPSGASSSPQPANGHSITLTSPSANTPWEDQGISLSAKMGDHKSLNLAAHISPGVGVASSELSIDEISPPSTIEDANLASAMSTTQESINTEEMNVISTLPSKHLGGTADRSDKQLQHKESVQSNRSDITKDSMASASAMTAPLPEMWQKMSCQIRSAVARSMPSTNVVKRAPSLIEKDALGVESAPTEYMIEITDELREFTEVKMKQGELTHNKEVISMDVLLNHVVKYNRQHPKSPLNIAPALQRSCIVGKSQQYPELVTEGLRPVERLRLSSMERTYQKMLTRSTPIFKKLQKVDSRGDEIPDTLMIELKSSLAMAVSLLCGLFLSFAVGWFGGPFIGLRSTVSRAILGLILTVLCMFTEMVLIILRASKLDRMRSMKIRRQQRALDHARLKLTKSPTPSTEATNDHNMSSVAAHDDMIKED